jgi:PAS domain S-box-containing protein
MEKARILIVEDEAIIAMEIENQLQGLGYKVTSIVDTGAKAIKKAEEDKPVIILMDIRIKGEMDGIQTAAIIREQFDIPVIFSTAYLDEERIELAKLTMPFGYVLKPVQERDLKVTIEMALFVAENDKKRKHTEKALKHSEEIYKSLFTNMLNGFALHEVIRDETDKVVDYRFLDVNPGYEEYTGISGKKAINKTVRELFPGIENDEGDWINKYGQVVDTGIPITFNQYFEPLNKYFTCHAYKTNTNCFAVMFTDITEQFNLQQALKKSEETFKSAESVANVGTWEWNIKTNELYWSDNVYRLFGWKPKEVFIDYETCRAKIHPDDVEMMEEKVQKAIEKNIEFNTEHRIKPIGSQEYRTHFSRAKVNYDKDGNPESMNGLVRDITELKEQEQALKESEQLLQSIADNFPNSFLSVVNEDYTVGWSGGQEFKKLGLNPDDFVGMKTEDVFGENFKTIKHYYDKTFAGENQEFELFINEQHQLYRTVALPSKGHKRMVSVVENITERKQAQQELIKSEEILRRSENIGNTGSWEFDLTTTEIIWSGNLYNLYERDRELGPPSNEEVGKYYSEEDNLRLRGYMQDIIHTSKPVKNFECDVILDSSIITVIGSMFPVLDKSGKLIKIFGTLQDVTKLKEQEQALQESEEKHWELFETMALGVVYQDADGKITDANPAAERILGLSLDQMQGRTSIDPRWKAIHEDGSDFPGETHPGMVALKTGKKVNNVIMGVFHPEKEEHRWININAIPKFREGESTPYENFVTFDDVTELKTGKK